ncbi:MAG: serine/threonine protein kinase [Myxococcales bacterium FL481]|nr:MAG: serine/threonine protein kinase [Myxococcales bacterium FL481]
MRIRAANVRPSSVIPEAPNAAVAGELRKRAVRAALFARPIEPFRVSRYVLLSRVGQGGMGEVYVAYDEQLDRKLALKLVRTDQLGDARAETRLMEEARTLAQLSHPNVVQVYEIGRHEGRVFIAMEFIRGQTLREWVHQLAAKPRWHQDRRLIDAFVQAGRGLAAVHRAGLTHRDFKPENVLVSGAGRVCVVDFGLARGVDPTGRCADADDRGDSDAVGATQPSPPVSGTPGYVAPEILRGAAPSPRSDQFSFCVALSESLESLRDGPSSTTRPRLLHRFRDFLSPGYRLQIHRLLRRGLADEPSRRFADMDALVDALESARHRVQRRVAVGVLAVGLVGTGAAWHRHETSTGPCEEAGLELASVWNEARRHVVWQRFAAPPGSYVEQARGHIVNGLERYAESWAATNRRACEDHWDGDQPLELYRQQLGCLERRKSALASALALLTRSSVIPADKAVLVVDALPSTATCEDPSDLLAQPPRPSGEALADRVEALRDTLDEASARFAAGRYPSALDLAEQAVRRAENTGYEPAHGEALLVAGRAAMHINTSEAREQATTYLERAAAIHLAAGRHELGVEALARLLFVRSKRDAQGAIDLGTIALALATQLPPSAFARNLMLNNLGVLYLTHGDRLHAQTLFDQAVDGAATTLEHVELVSAWHNLAMVTPEPDRREALLADALQMLRDRLGERHPYTLRAQLLSGLDTVDPARAHRRLAATCGELEQFRDYARASKCFFYLGLLDATLGDPVQAASRMAAVRRVVPASGARGTLGELDALAQGYAALFRDDARAALTRFQAIVDDHPESDHWYEQRWRGEVYLGRGLSAWRVGRLALARRSLRQARDGFRRWLQHRHAATVERRCRVAEQALEQLASAVGAPSIPPSVLRTSEPQTAPSGRRRDAQSNLVPGRPAAAPRHR